MRALLDVNVLLALFDSEHAHHARARAWWVQNRDQGWASCPLTQNGFIRIMSSPGYPRPLIVADALSVLVPGIIHTWQGPECGYATQMTRHFSVAPESPICESGY